MPTGSLRLGTKERRTDERTNQPMSERVNERNRERTNEPINQRTNNEPGQNIHRTHIVSIILIISIIIPLISNAPLTLLSNMRQTTRGTF